MKGNEVGGSKTERTAKTPALGPSNQEPPRTNAPGRLPKPFALDEPSPPKQLRSLPARGTPTTVLCVVQSAQLFARSLQSATHSSTFPTMSNAPQLDLQLDRDPVFTGLMVELVAHVVVPSSATPGSGVPAAARCHSSFRTRCLPDTAHACWA